MQTWIMNLNAQRFIGFILMIGLTLGTTIMAAAATPATSLADYQGLSPVVWTGPQPGAAIATVTSNSITVSNNILSMSWSVNGSTIAITNFHNKMTNTDIPLTTNTQLFLLTRQNNTTIANTNMTLTSGPTLTTLTGNPSAIRLSDRENGKKVTVMLHYSGTVTFDVAWSVILRNEANNVTQQFVITPSGSLDLKTSKLVDVNLTGAIVKGSATGSPVVAGDAFIGFENPISSASVASNRVQISLTRVEPTINTPITYTTGTGLVPTGQLRRGFQYYVERERAHARRSWVTYYSWLDVTPSDSALLPEIDLFGTQLKVNRGSPIDAYLVDDGWDAINTAPVWGVDLTKFPNKFLNAKAKANSYGGNLAVWMSPFGGYGSSHNARINANLTLPVGQRMETDADGFNLAGPIYFSRFGAVTLDFQANQGIKMFKFDGMGGNAAESEMKTANTLRVNDPSVYINATVGTWQSPYFFWTVDSIWRGGADSSQAGTGTNRQKYITYRDWITYQNTVANPLMSYNAEMFHGIIYSNQDGNAPICDLTTSACQKDVKDDMKAYVGLGSQFVEYYITGSQVGTNAFFWNTLANNTLWSRNNVNVLADAHWIGGDPSAGAVYGSAAWTPNKATLMLRNPSSSSKTFSIDPQTVFDLPAGASQSWSFTEKDGARAPMVISAGSPLQFNLSPYEVVVYEAIPSTAATPTQTPTRTNTPVGPTNTPTRTNTPSASGSVNANNVATAPTIDGLLNEAGWNLATTASKTTMGAPNNTTTFGTMWDATYFYVGVKVLDSNLFNDSANVWDDDGVEVMIDANHNHGTTYDSFDRQYIKGYNDSTLLAASGSATGVLHASAAITGGYSVELAIPWSNLAVTPSTGMVMGLDVGYDDDDNGAARDAQAVWWGTANDWGDTSAFGDVVLTGGSGPTATFTAVVPTATRTNTPVGPTATFTRTPTRTNTPVGPTATFTRTATRTSTPAGPTATATRTNTPAAGGSVNANNVATAPTIDGLLNEAGWNLATTASKATMGAPNNTVTFGTMWDSTYFYVGVKVLDSNLFNDSANVWDDDGVEIMIDANHNKGTTYDSFDRQYLKGYNDSTLLAASGSATGVLHASAAITGGYSVELAIPWSNLGVTPTAGMVMGLDIGYDDDDNGGVRDAQAVWWGTANDWGDTSAFGDVILK